MNNRFRYMEMCLTFVNEKQVYVQVMICDISMRKYAIIWFVIVFGYGVYVFYDAYMLQMISLFVYGFLSF
ncbi:hypothetical protein F383_31368 [Gossypium arboreum]|uniref:Uncharacterized protein n=1 Tax=Gossypium arboreum TaxID=29729 RepID=A0A0B0PHU5_GOSAR|nr:hypothetical protein F383_31368 [Gossypium arboreum]